ncbi:branched-chain amino acid ABC transporter permease [Nocardioides sp. BE266]|uniref:branched-chain amino acid ABC transporter permease n=1 Tax=Nocardioides sp. BE266 TaxID=2817725 RepID=UPI00286A64A7|nr:branched-chain amino acid ABC transporter permease [Nocardioides sp. BE266]
MQAVASGLFLAALYGLAAFGLTIVYGVLDILNFAHGALLVLAAYLTAEFVLHDVPFWVSALLSIGLIAGVGALLELSVFRRVERDHTAGLVASIGVIAIVGSIILQVWGPEPYSLPRLATGSVEFFGANLLIDRLLIIGIAAVALTAAELYISRAGWGKVLRAVAADPDSAYLNGIRVRRVKTAAFTIGAALAAFAGILIGTASTFDASLGEQFVLKAFIIIILGGVGSTKGTIGGAIILGMAEAFGVAYLDIAVAQLVPLAVLAMVLLVRPQGLFGKVSQRV